jgi:hypothetical protein
MDYDFEDKYKINEMKINNKIKGTSNGNILVAKTNSHLDLDKNIISNSEEKFNVIPKFQNSESYSVNYSQKNKVAEVLEQPIIYRSNNVNENESKIIETNKKIPKLYPVKTLQVVGSKNLHPVVYSSPLPIHEFGSSLQNNNPIKENLNLLSLTNVPINNKLNFIRTHLTNPIGPSESQNHNNYEDISTMNSRHLTYSPFSTIQMPLQRSMLYPHSETFKFNPIPIQKATYPLGNKFTNDDFYSVNFLQKSQRLRGSEAKFFKHYKSNLYDSVMKYYYGG